jgi:sulfite exporter TauE/SafE
VDQALFLSAVLMGLAGTPHCLAMCGAACTAASGGGRPRDLLPFHLGRLLAYAGAGAVVAASVGSLAALGQAVAALRPLWTMVHMAALALGLYLVWQGRQPAWMERLGRTRSTAVPHRPGERWQAIRGPTRSAGVGLAWVAWPCGLLQSALLVASLANTPWSGAAVMAGFAGASAAGLVLGPALWWRLTGGKRRGAVAGAAAEPVGATALSATTAVRWAGAALAAASVWALGHGLWVRLVTWCFS